MVEVQFIWLDNATGKQIGARLLVNGKSEDVLLADLQRYRRYLSNAEITKSGIQGKNGTLRTIPTDLKAFAPPQANSLSASEVEAAAPFEVY